MGDGAPTIYELIAHYKQKTEVLLKADVIRQITETVHRFDKLSLTQKFSSMLHFLDVSKKYIDVAGLLERVQFSTIQLLEGERDTSFQYSMNYRPATKDPTEWHVIYPLSPYLFRIIYNFIGNSSADKLQWGKARGLVGKRKIVITRGDGKMLAIIDGCVPKSDYLTLLYAILRDVFLIPE